MFFNAFVALVLRQYLVYLDKKAEKTELEISTAMSVEDEKRSQIGVENEGYGFRNVL